MLGVTWSFALERDVSQYSHRASIKKNEYNGSI